MRWRGAFDQVLDPTLLDPGFLARLRDVLRPSPLNGQDARYPESGCRPDARSGVSKPAAVERPQHQLVAVSQLRVLVDEPRTANLPA